MGDASVALTSRDPFLFYENGSLKSATLVDSSRIIQGKECGVEDHFTPVTFDPNGKLKSCITKRQVFFRKEEAIRLTFDSRGQVISTEKVNLEDFEN